MKKLRRTVQGQNIADTLLLVRRTVQGAFGILHLWNAASTAPFLIRTNTRHRNVHKSVDKLVMKFAPADEREPPCFLRRVVHD